MARRVDPSRLPSVTRARFALLLMIVLIITFSYSQTLAIVWDAPDWPYAISLLNGAVGSLIALAIAAAFYLVHPLVRVRSFGSCQVVKSDHSMAQRIETICHRVDIAVPHLLIDTDIRNYDALAFGWPWWKTILMGRGLMLLEATRPREFDARLAHELGHIKNKDIAITFLAQGLIAVSTLLFVSGFIVWMYSSAAVFIEEWQQSQSSGATAFKFLMDSSNWIGLSLLIGVAKLFKTAFWAGILLTEHRSFLRVRELYADNVAAAAVGSEAIKNALGQKPLEPQALIWRRAYRTLFAAHPQLPWRKAVVENPLWLYEPVPARSALIGYSIGLLVFTILIIRDLPALGGAKTMDAVIKAMFTTVEGVMTNIFMTILVFAPILALGSLILRTSIWVLLNNHDFKASVKSVIKTTLSLSIGILLGISLNPITIERFVMYRENILPDFLTLVLSVGTAIYMLIVVVVYSLIMRRLFTSQQDTSPSRVMWIMLSLTLYVSSAYLLSATLAIFDPDVAARGDTVSLGSALLGITAIWWLVGYLLARRTISPKPQPATSIAPWVWQTMKTEKSKLGRAD
jgi:Zn-dependent protease with chaperone function